jgi:SNF family Na+-dependent transporter
MLDLSEQDQDVISRLIGLVSVSYIFAFISLILIIILNIGLLDIAKNWWRIVSGIIGLICFIICITFLFYTAYFHYEFQVHYEHSNSLIPHYQLMLLGAILSLIVTFAFTSLTCIETRYWNALD